MYICKRQNYEAIQTGLLCLAWCKLVFFKTLYSNQYLLTLQAQSSKLDRMLFEKKCFKI